MGSLTSGPRAPRPQPQIVFVPQPTATPAPQPSTPAPSAPPAETPEEASAEVRRQNLLGRERSRFGTVQTSFRGLLGLANESGTQNRKTLLGE